MSHIVTGPSKGLDLSSQSSRGSLDTGTDLAGGGLSAPSASASGGGGGGFPTPENGWYSYWVADDIPDADAAALTSWPEATGSGIFGALTTAAGTATVRATGLNGQPALELANATVNNDPGTVTWPFSGPSTIIFVFKLNGTGSTQTIFTSSLNDAGLYITGAGANWQALDDGSAEATTQAKDTDLHVCVMEYSSTGEVWMDGESIYTGIGNNWLPSSGVTVTGFGQWNSGTAIPMISGLVAFLGFVDGVLTDADRQSIESWAATKYGITLP